MSVEYVSVQWNRQKKFYDAVLVGGVAVHLVVFIMLTKLLYPRVTDEIMLIRAFGTGALLLLHIILCIGPLARLDPRFLPLLYNRRHFGVATFLVALGHGLLVLGYYHGFGVISAPLSLLTSTRAYGSTAAFPFEILGIIALLILFVMGATSHDFWLKN